ncbi:dedA protein (plasmid) [Deinococcus geothermalis DSM 11300]|uniref:DedA protein n=1 Tax=Deinococcus geothermalis (strain DSM 11300 / CIP 105573 / AG-3a) TaxID=319795 RepID=Q1J3L8_DEIGD|nr:DedA family protein [Deinococcus geothermalis]ABF43916.1 dedA protein [Deinococcus geothermalis DSM 11300]
MSFDLTHLLHSASYAGIFGIVFAETGLLIGFFLPGDTLLITAGILAQQGNLSLAGVMLAVAAGAILGDSTGYALGRRFGPAIFQRPDSRLFRPEYVTRTRAFFERYGGLALTLAQFVPIVRTVAPTLAGVGQMPYPRFVTFNVIGVLLWAGAVPLLGYWLGGLVPHLDRYILLVVGAVVLLSLVAVGVELRKGRLARR